MTAGESPYWCEEFYRQFEPLVVGMSGPIQEGINALKVEYFSALPNDIRNRLQRSIYWISHSLSHESDDHRLVDLCTALEILLIPEGRREPSKGTVIALRYKLLGGHLNASAIKWLYDRRNDVIHGGPLPVIGPRDTWELRMVCCETLRQIVYSSSNQPGLLTLQELIAALYTEENLLSFIKYAPMGVRMDSNLTKVIDEAKRRLQRLQRTGN